MNTNSHLVHGRCQRRPLRSCIAVATAAAVATLTMALAGAPASVAANEAAAPVMARVTELERQFWLCDHAATRTMFDFASAARCSAATEELRKLRFGGDFQAMLAWWRERKAAEHAALDAAPASDGTAPAAPVQGAAAPRKAAPARGAEPTRGPAPTRGAAPAPVPPRPLDSATPEQLKAAYLHCDRLATTEHFDRSTVVVCSIVYETLKARVFGGSTERLIAWRQQQQAAPARGGGVAARP